MDLTGYIDSPVTVRIKKSHVKKLHGDTVGRNYLENLYKTNARSDIVITGISMNDMETPVSDNHYRGGGFMGKWMTIIPNTRYSFKETINDAYIAEPPRVGRNGQYYVIAGHDNIKMKRDGEKRNIFVWPWKHDEPSFHGVKNRMKGFPRNCYGIFFDNGRGQRKIMTRNLVDGRPIVDCDSISDSLIIYRQKGLGYKTNIGILLLEQELFDEYMDESFGPVFDAFPDSDFNVDIVDPREWEALPGNSKRAFRGKRKKIKGHKW